MTNEREIPENVLRFIEANIDTVPQLETLVMMSQDDSRTWEVPEIAMRMYISPQHAQETIAALHRRGLALADESGRAWRFDAAPETRALVAEVSRCYQANLSGIARFIHSKPSASVREFARAFDLKKDR